ncbi:MAG: hypothetical protein HQK54_14425, partial [Oligoflexales bacterium]|nr:hypothetical protein [Oligoflexales bacterium]
MKAVFLISMIAGSFLYAGAAFAQDNSDSLKKKQGASAKDGASQKAQAGATPKAKTSSASKAQTPPDPKA